MDIEKMFEGEGGYVFVSHSHLDLKEVREVRNFLEESGVEPILFYLRSMENGGEEKTKLLRSLIYDEIDSREFFLYLDSEHAKNSKWVQEEVAYITKTAPDKVFTASLKEGVDGIKRRLRGFLRQMRVYISYSHKDFELMNKLKKALIANDFRVYADDGTSVGMNWMNEVAATLADLSQEGSVVVLLTKNSLESAYVFREVTYAISCGVEVICLIVGEPGLSDALQTRLNTSYRIKSADDEEGIEKFVQLLKENIRRKQR